MAQHNNTSLTWETDISIPQIFRDHQTLDWMQFVSGIKCLGCCLLSPVGMLVQTVSPSPSPRAAVISLSPVIRDLDINTVFTIIPDKEN